MVWRLPIVAQMCFSAVAFVPTLRLTLRYVRVSYYIHHFAPGMRESADPANLLLDVAVARQAWNLGVQVDESFHALLLKELLSGHLHLSLLLFLVVVSPDSIPIVSLPCGPHRALLTAEGPGSAPGQALVQLGDVEERTRHAV